MAFDGHQRPGLAVSGGTMPAAAVLPQFVHIPLRFSSGRVQRHDSRTSPGQEPKDLVRISPAGSEAKHSFSASGCHPGSPEHHRGDTLLTPPHFKFKRSEQFGYLCCTVCEHPM